MLASVFLSALALLGSAWALPAATYDPTALDSTYQSTEVALEALIAALNQIQGSDPATLAAKAAYNDAKNNITAFGEAAMPGIGSCPEQGSVVLTTSSQAITATDAIELDVQKAYAETRAQQGTAHGDFCNITAHLHEVNTYVQA